MPFCSHSPVSVLLAVLGWVVRVLEDCCAGPPELESTLPLGPTLTHLVLFPEEVFVEVMLLLVAILSCDKLEDVVFIEYFVDSMPDRGLVGSFFPRC